MGITKKDAEKHLAHLARRRARYAEKKKQQAMKTVSWDDEFNGRQPEVIAAFQHAVATSGMVFVDDPDAHGKIVDTGVLLIAPEVAPTPHAHDVAINETVAQLALPFENRVARIAMPAPTARQQAEIDYENSRTVSEWRAYINQILNEEGR